MNSPITFPPPAPALKLVRPSAEKWAATLAEERRRLQEDQEALREREANLREYEARLRSLQLEIEASRTIPPTAPAGLKLAAQANGSAAQRSGVTAGPFQRPSSRAPFTDDPALQTGWEKLHRARELLEAEQTHMRDDRIGLREMEAALKRREEAVAAREAKLVEREALIVAASTAAEQSAMSKMTQAPFKMARAVLRGKK